MTHIQIRAFAIVNSGYRCYFTCLPVIDILDHMMVDEWSYENRFGYQRKLDNRRLGSGKISILKGIEDGVTNPSSIVVNTREKLVYNEDSVNGNISYGYLEIPDYVNFWIIDGRHRLESYRKLSDNDKKILTCTISLVIYDDIDIGYETRLFFTLNTSKLTLNKGIEYRNIQNLGRHYGEEYILENFGKNDLNTYRAVEITDKINTIEESPFKEKICIYGSIFENSHLIKDVEMINSIKDILNKNPLESNINKISSSIINYWNALKNMYPEAYHNSNKFTIFRYPGIYIFNMIFFNIEKKITNSTEESYEKYLNKLNTKTEKHPQIIFREPLKIESWDANNGENIFRSRNPQILNFVYSNIMRKLEL